MMVGQIILMIVQLQVIHLLIEMDVVMLMEMDGPTMEETILAVIFHLLTGCKHEMPTVMDCWTIMVQIVVEWMEPMNSHLTLDSGLMPTKME